MKLVVQRVLNASVSVERKVEARIGRGLAVLLGIHKNDSSEQIPLLVDKLVGLRIFEDDKKKMNLSLIDVKGELLIVSQFTLYANCNFGKRPSFTESAPAAEARLLYDQFIQEATKKVETVKAGIFGAGMQVELINDGPVTVILENGF